MSIGFFIIVFFKILSLSIINNNNQHHHNKTLPPHIKLQIFLLIFIKSWLLHHLKLEIRIVREGRCWQDVNAGRNMQRVPDPSFGVIFTGDNPCQTQIWGEIGLLQVYCVESTGVPMLPNLRSIKKITRQCTVVVLVLDFFSNEENYYCFVFCPCM